MPRLNLYEQQTTAQGPRASGAEFGAAPAQAMEGAGNELQVIGNRIQERENLSDRQRLREAFEEAAVPMLDDFDKRRDINSKESIPQFRQALEQKRQELIGKHAGNPESRAKLENQLDNLVSQYTKSAIGAKVKADQDLMVRTLNQQFDKSALSTDAAPDIWSFAKDENLMVLEEMRPGMSQDQYVAAKRLAYSKPLQAAVKSHLAQGNWEGAQAIMRDESFSQFLTAQEAIPLRIDVAVGRGKQDKEKREVETNRKAMSSFFGYEISQDQAEQNPGFMKLPAIQKMSVWKMMNQGKEMPDDMKLRALDLDKRDSQDKSMRVAENMQNWEALSPQDKIWTRLELASKFPPVRITDPLTNEVTYAPNPAAGYAERQIMGFSPSSGTRPTGGYSSGQAGDMQVDPAVQADRDVERRRIVQSELTRFQGELDQATASGDTAKAAIAKQNVDSLTREIGRMGSAPDGTPVPSSPRDEFKSLYDSVPLMTGPGSKVMSIAEGMPLGIGNKVQEGWKGPIDDLSYEGSRGRYEKANRAALQLQNDIVDGLRGADEKIANQYREELKKIVTIDPQVFNSDRKLWTTYQTFDSTLREKKKHFEQIRDRKKPAGPDELRGAAYAINAIDNVLLRLDVPQTRVNSREELLKLKPGERFLYQDDPRPKWRTTGGWRHGNE